VENKVHYVRDVTREKLNPGLDNTTGSDLGMTCNFVLNLYRADGFENMAQAERVSLALSTSRGYLE